MGKLNKQPHPIGVTLDRAEAEITLEALKEYEQPAAEYLITRIERFLRTINAKEDQ